MWLAIYRAVFGVLLREVPQRVWSSTISKGEIFEAKLEFQVPNTVISWIHQLHLGFYLTGKPSTHL